MHKNYYKYSVDYYINNKNKKTIKCTLNEVKRGGDVSDVSVPFGCFWGWSLDELFTFDESKDEGITLDYFFDTLEDFVDSEDVVLSVSFYQSTLLVEIQRFSDRFYRVVDVYGFVFDDNNEKSLLHDERFCNRLNFLISKYNKSEIEYLNKAHTLMEKKKKLRSMYEYLFVMFDSYCRSGELVFDSIDFSIEDFIEFCGNESHRDKLISDYFEINRAEILSDKNFRRKRLLSFVSTGAVISAAGVASFVYAPFFINSSFMAMAYLGGMFGIPLGIGTCLSAFDGNILAFSAIKKFFENKFKSMISDIEAKYFVMGYEEDIPKLRG